MYFLVVDFHKTAPNQVRFTGIIFCNCYDLTEGSWNNASRFFVGIEAHHGVGFATTGLPIGEDGSIISIQHVIDE